VRELGRALSEELDYRLEARRLLRMRALGTGVVIPRVHHVAGRVLVLERLRGARLTDHLDDHPEDGDRLLGTLAASFARQILQHGFFHADPHPGNFLVVDGHLALLDFGCVGELDDDVRRAYGGLAGAILGRDAARLAGLLAALGFRARDPAALAELAASILPVDLSTFDPKAELARALALLRERPEVPDHFVLLGRVLTALGGLAARYRPRLDLLQIITAS
jgi:ubiquinone biosynthesis protein